MDESRKQQQLEDRILALEKGQNETLELLTSINNTLKPIMETYNAASKIGKWLMGFLLFISILAGIIAAIVTIFKK